MKARDGFVLRNIMDDHILVPVGSRIKDFRGTIVMNELSAFIWEKLQKSVTEAELLSDILDEYDIDEEAAKRDLTALLEKLRDFEVLED